jgi:RNA polymerase sigma-70 factor (ECF subfamily)
MVLDLRRGTKRKEKLLERYGAGIVPPVEASMLRFDHDKLRRCVRSLAERERTVVVMSFFDQQTGADVAGFLGISKANVRVIRHRAIRQRRECIGVAL